MKKISILAQDLSHNCLGRAYLLAKILQRTYDVEIVGPLFGDEIWPPVANDASVNYKYIMFERFPIDYYKIIQLYNMVDGDIVYASKNLITSYGIGILYKLFKKKPLILDIDDFEMGFVKYSYKHYSILNRIKSFLLSIPAFYKGGSYFGTYISEKLTCYADKITVSNSFLNNKFGGTIIYHGRDTEMFNPDLFTPCTIKQYYQIADNAKIVLFLGTPRPYKGLEDLIQAVVPCATDVNLLLIGIDHKDNYCKYLSRLGHALLGERFIEMVNQPFEKIPELISIADIVIIPQRKNIATYGQVPAKIFDAMAMAKPIIATNVSDIPDILQDCGWIIEPSKPNLLTQLIQYILSHPEEAFIKGQKARQKCIEKYSYDAIERQLKNIFEPIF